MAVLGLDPLISLTTATRLPPEEIVSGWRVNSVTPRHPLARVITPATVGGKAFSLYRMSQMGLCVPPACVLSMSAWRLWKADPVGTRLPKLCSHAFNFVAQHAGSRNKLAVRSGAPVSMPGMMDTKLDVGEGGVYAAVVEVFNSFESPRCRAYRTAHGIGEIGTAVIIQAMAPMESSTIGGAGVACSIDPVTGRGWGVFGEVVPGMRGNKLVGGEVTPIAISKWRRSHAKLYDLLRIGLAALENEWGAPVEVEFAWCGGALFYLQCRAAKISHPALYGFTQVRGRWLGRGRSASGGTAKGIVSTAVNFHEGGVWVAPITTPEDYPLMVKSTGIVTLTGGTTCHAAVVAREMKVPCVVAYDGEPLLSGMEIVVDGGTGEVYAA